MAPSQTVDVIEELLPGLDLYLRFTLAQETLSLDAHKNRKYFVNLIDFFRSTLNATFYPNHHLGSSLVVDRVSLKKYDDVTNRSREDPGSRFSLAERTSPRDLGPKPNSAGRLPPPTLPKPVRNLRHSRSRTCDVPERSRDRSLRSSSPEGARRTVVSRDCRSISPLVCNHSNRGPPVAPKPIKCKHCNTRNRGVRISVQNQESQIAIATSDVVVATDLVTYDVTSQTSQVTNACESTQTEKGDVTSSLVQTDLSFLGLEDMVDSLIEFNFDARIEQDTTIIDDVTSDNNKTNSTCDNCGENMAVENAAEEDKFTSAECENCLVLELTSGLNETDSSSSEGEGSKGEETPFENVLISSPVKMTSSTDMVHDQGDVDADEFGYQMIHFEIENAYDPVDPVETKLLVENEYTDLSIGKREPEPEVPPALPERPSFLRVSQRADPGCHGDDWRTDETGVRKSPVAKRLRSPVAMGDGMESPPPLPPRRVAPPIKEPETPVSPSGGLMGAPLATAETGVILGDYGIERMADKETSTSLDQEQVSIKEESGSDDTSYESYDDDVSDVSSRNRLDVANDDVSDVSSRHRLDVAIDVTNDVAIDVTTDVANDVALSAPSPVPDRKTSPALSLPRLQSFRHPRRRLQPSPASPSQSASLPRDDVSGGHRNIFGVSGELYHRGKLRRWTRRHCIIHDGKFLCYKSDRDSKPMLSFALADFDLAYVEKDGKRSHVLRLSHPGYDTYLFSTDSKESADRWIAELTIASGHAAPDNNRWSNASNDSMTHDDSRDERVMSSNSLSSMSQTSNHSDGDPTCAGHLATPVQTREKLSPSSGRRQNYRRLSSPASQNVISRATPLKTAETTPTEPRRKLGVCHSPDPNRLSAPVGTPKRRSLLFGSWGRKKKHSGAGLEMSAPMNLEVYEGANLAVTLSGSLNIKSSLGHVADWARRYCQLKDGFFECYRDIMSIQPDFRFPLMGCSVVEVKVDARPLAFKVIQGESVKAMIEPCDIFDQGRWLNVLIRETGMTQNPPDLSDQDDDDESLHSNGSLHDNNARPPSSLLVARERTIAEEERATSLVSVASSEEDGYEKQGLPSSEPRYNPYYDYVQNPSNVMSLDDGYAQIRVPSEGSEKDHWSDSEVVIKPKSRDIYAVVQKRKSTKKRKDEKDVLTEAITRCFGEKALDSMPTLKRWQETGFYSDRFDIPCHSNGTGTIDDSCHGDEGIHSNKDVESEDYYAEDYKPHLPSREDLDRRSVIGRASLLAHSNDSGLAKLDDILVASGSKKDSGIVEDTSDGSVKILVTDTSSRTIEIVPDSVAMATSKPDSRVDQVHSANEEDEVFDIVGSEENQYEKGSESDHDYEDVGLSSNELTSLENIYQEIDTLPDADVPPVPPRRPVRTPSPSLPTRKSNSDLSTFSGQWRLSAVTSYGSSASLDARPRSRSSPNRTVASALSIQSGNQHSNEDSSSEYNESTHASISFSQSGDKTDDEDDENFYDPIDYGGNLSTDGCYADQSSVAIGGYYGDEDIYETYSDHEQEVLEMNRKLFAEQRELVKEQRRHIARLKKRRLAAENRKKFSRDLETRLKHSEEFEKLNQEVTTLDFDLDLAERKLSSLAVMCRLEEGQGRRHRRSSSISSVQSNGW